MNFEFHQRWLPSYLPDLWTLISVDGLSNWVWYAGFVSCNRCMKFLWQLGIPIHLAIHSEVRYQGHHGQLLKVESESCEDLRLCACGITIVFSQLVSLVFIVVANLHMLEKESIVRTCSK